MGSYRLETFFVNTYETCFICLEASECTRAVSYRLLQRYLKINLKGVLNHTSSSPSSSSSRVAESASTTSDVSATENIDLVVSMCPRCSKEMSKFATLYNELEGVQLRIQGSLHRFHGLIERAESDPNLLLQCGQRLTRRDGPIQVLITAGIMDKLRTATVEKCATRSQHNPKVGIVRVEDTWTRIGDGVYSIDYSRSGQDVPLPQSASGFNRQQWPEKDLRAHSSSPQLGSHFQTPPTRQSCSINASSTRNDKLTSSYTSYPPAAKGRPTKAGKAPIFKQTPKSRSTPFMKHISKGKFKCFICNKIITSPIYHKSMHTGEKNYKCTWCHRRFGDTGSLRGHNMTVHRYESLLKFKDPRLSLEGYKTWVRSFLNIYIKHLDVKSFECVLCNTKLKYRKSVEYHLTRKHMDYLQIHVKAQDQTRPVKLTDRSPTTVSSKPRGKSMKQGRGRPRKRTSLKKTRSTNMCSSCNRSFSTAHHLNQHLKTHTEEKLYPCAYCVKRFDDNWGLTRHVRGCHKIKLLSEWRHEGFTDFDFENIINQVILGQMVDCPGGNNSLNKKCLFCRKLFTLGRHCEDHMMQVHIDDIGLKLVGYQNGLQLQSLVAATEAGNVVNEELPAQNDMITPFQEIQAQPVMSQERTSFPDFGMCSFPQE